MKRIGLMLAGFGLLATGLMAQMAGDRGQTSLELNGGKVSIEYGRPALAGRDVKSMLQPGMEWRMGSNAATTLDTNIDLKFGNKTVAKGKYVLKAKFVEEGKWLLLVTEDEKTLAEAPMTTRHQCQPGRKRHNQAREARRWWQTHRFLGHPERCGHFPEGLTATRFEVRAREVRTSN